MITFKIETFKQLLTAFGVIVLLLIFSFTAGFFGGKKTQKKNVKIQEASIIVRDSLIPVEVETMVEEEILLEYYPDTAAIINDYFSKKTYKDTLQFDKPITGIVLTNKIQFNELKTIEYMPTLYREQQKQKKTKYGIALGTGLYLDGRMSFDIGISYRHLYIGYSQLRLIDDFADVTHGVKMGFVFNF